MIFFKGGFDGCIDMIGLCGGKKYGFVVGVEIFCFIG